MQAGRRSQLFLALKDLKDGVLSVSIWPKLGWLEIQQRYRRSVLGPFWLTVSTGVMVGAMGPLYGRLFGLDISSYLSFLAISFVVWQFLAGILNDACTAFILAEGFIKQVKLPLTTHVLRMVWKNLIIFAHNILIIVLVLTFWPPQLTWYLLSVPLGVLFIVINGVWIGILLGLMCARFRDIPQIVGSLVQVAFFLTPVIWKPELLGRNQWAATWNPFFHFLEVVRSPLIAGTASLHSWVVILGITIVGYAATVLLFARFRARIAYWV